MSQRLEDIQRRKQLLISRAAAQRSELAYLALTVNSPLRFIDDVLAVIRAFRIHPVLAGVALSSILATPRNRLLFWVGRIFTGWQVYRAIREQWPRRP